MADEWLLGPPLSDEQLPPACLGSPIRIDFSINTVAAGHELTTCLEWVGLSRQEVADLRSLLKAEAFLALLSPWSCGLGQGAVITLSTEPDPKDAEFTLMIDSKESIPLWFINEITALIGHYRVQ